MTTVSWATAAWFRLKRSALPRGLDSPESVASLLLGLQAQDLSAAGLAASARCPTASHADIARRLYRERSLVKLWGPRNTLHLYATRDWPVVFGAVGRGRSAFERGLERQGVDLDKVFARLDEFIERSKHMESFGYEDLRSADLGLAGLDIATLSATWGDVCLTIERRAPVCHAEPVSGASRFAHHDQWLPDTPWRPLTEEEAAREIVRRYLATYGPASTEDLAHWAGISLAKARRWLADCGEGLSQVDVDGVPMWQASADYESLTDQHREPEHWARLLGKYDPLLLAHKSKDWLIDPEERGNVWRSAGRVEAVVLVDGRIGGTWRYRRRPHAIDLTIGMFGQPPACLTAMLRDEAQRIGDHFGLETGQVTITTEDPR